jgi:methionyl-tRNA synthetase
MNKPANHLLIAGAPTPNGRLHLGHIGAQFLKLDVLKRHIRRAGGNAMYCFSLDTFDTPIYILARQQGRTEAEVCRENVLGIREDLANVAIDYDLLLDTSTDEARETIRRSAVALDRLVEPRKVAVTDKVAYSRRDGSPLVGRMLTGECPKCGRTIRGLACDPCGLFLSSIDSVRDLRTADPKDSLELRDVTNYYVRVDSQAIRDYHDSLSLPAVTRGKLAEIADLLLDDDHYLTRWTASVPYGVGTGVPGQVFYNVMLATLAEQYTFGELARQRFGLPCHPFEHDSDTVTVIAYGVDNLGVFGIDNPAQALATHRFRTFDHQLVSEFYTVAGEKLSTSKPNAMWVADAAALPGFSPDGLRGYLLSVATPDVEVDISMPALQEFLDTVGPRLNQVVARASAKPSIVVDEEIAVLAQKSVERQATALAVPHIDLPLAWQITEDWIDRVVAGAPGDMYSVLAGFAAVAAPTLPVTTRAVWRSLGLAGEPDLAGLRRFVGHDR